MYGKTRRLYAMYGKVYIGYMQCMERCNRLCAMYGKMYIGYV